MSIEIAKTLFENGHAHAISGTALYGTSLNLAAEAGAPDAETFGFNGTCSLSVFYLICLALELYLKAAYVFHGGASDNASLKAIGHDLVKALDNAEERGFVSNAPHLREIVGLLTPPYKDQVFRYSRPDQVYLPEVPGVTESLQVLDDELRAVLYSGDGDLTGDL